MQDSEYPRFCCQGSVGGEEAEVEEDSKPKSWLPRALMARAQVALGLKLRFRALWQTTRMAKWSNEGKEEIVAVGASISRIG